MSSEAIAEDIIHELLGRGGFDAWWYDVDRGTREEIQERIAMVVRDHIPEPSTPAAKAGDGWIRCSDALPPDDNPVLAFDPNWNRPATALCDGGVWGDIESNRICHPTHWQPLPAPPKPTEGGDGG